MARSPMAAKGRYVSDRSHLTVLEPNPLNARQEAFARNIAEGCCQREAYRSAGYAPTSDDVADVNASRLLRHAQVQSRVRELQAVQAEASQITAERLLAELEEARSLARRGYGQRPLRLERAQRPSEFIEPCLPSKRRRSSPGSRP